MGLVCEGQTTCPVLTRCIVSEVRARRRMNLSSHFWTFPQLFFFQHVALKNKETRRRMNQWIESEQPRTSPVTFARSSGWPRCAWRRSWFSARAGSPRCLPARSSARTSRRTRRSARWAGALANQQDLLKFSEISIFAIFWRVQFQFYKFNFTFDIGVDRVEKRPR